SITHHMFDEHCVLEPRAAEPVREDDNRKRRAAAGDWRVIDCVRRNLSRNNGSPGIAELAAHEFMDLWQGVHLCRTREVLPPCARGFLRRIQEIDHQFALALWIVVVRA